VSDEDLVQRQQRLAVVQPGGDHRSLLHLGPPAGHGLEQRSGSLRMRHQDPVELLGVGIDAQHQLPPQVLGQVGDQAILTSGDHQITGLEQATEGRSKRPAS